MTCILQLPENYEVLRNNCDVRDHFVYVVSYNYLLRIFYTYKWANKGFHNVAVSNFLVFVIGIFLVLFSLCFSCNYSDYF